MTLEKALNAVLQADVSGQARAEVSKVAGWAWEMSCAYGTDPQRQQLAGAFLQLATELREHLLSNSVVSRSKSPETANSTAENRRQESIPSWLAEARNVVFTRSQGLLRTNAEDPAGIWCQLHLAGCWLDTADWTVYAEALRAAAPGDPPTGYLIPPLAELGVAGLDFPTAMRHPVVIAAVAAWPRQRLDQCASLISLISTTFTFVDHCEGLYTATEHGGLEVEPVDSESKRAAYRNHLQNLLAKLAPAHLEPSQELVWLAAIDEALRSVFPLPFPSPWSWWAGQLTSSFELLAQRASGISKEARIVLIKAGEQFSSAERKKYAGKDNNLPITPEQDTDLGRVLWPLRAYVSLPATSASSPQVREGRVAYGHEHGYRRLQKQAGTAMPGPGYLRS